MLDLAGNSLLGVVLCNHRCNSDLQPVQSTVPAHCVVAALLQYMLLLSQTAVGTLPREQCNQQCIR